MMADMYLPYGVNDDGQLIYIDQVARGRTSLHCPYCGRGLIARKGDVIAPHFAHDGQTCRDVKRSTDAISLPCYDSFYSHVPTKARPLLRAFYRIYNPDDDDTDDKPVRLYRDGMDWLERLELIKPTYNYYRGWTGHELTHAGKVPFGLLSLNLFNQFQAPLLYDKLTHLEAAAHAALGTADEHVAETDLLIYRAQLRRIFGATLYFIEVRTDGKTLHKIGVTSRPLDQRIAEIRADLAPHFGAVEIKPISTWENRGNVELYFKFRYRPFNHPIGALTEYFSFDDVKPVLRDLRRMKPSGYPEYLRT
jgi:hypothetical protein